jgi:hypothetical protein
LENKHMKRFLIFSISILAIALTPACDSSGGGGMSLDTGLSESVALSELTEDEQIAACEATNDYMGSMAMSDAEMQHMGCIDMAACVKVLSFEDYTEAVCQTMYDECMGSGMGLGMEMDEPSDCTAEGLSACTDVTAGDMEACTNAYMAESMAAMAAANAMTCADIMAAMEAGEGEEAMEPTTPAACVTVADGCPAVAMGK